MPVEIDCLPPPEVGDQREKRNRRNESLRIRPYFPPVIVFVIQPTLYTRSDFPNTCRAPRRIEFIYPANRRRKVCALSRIRSVIIARILVESVKDFYSSVSKRLSADGSENRIFLYDSDGIFDNRINVESFQ